MISFSDTQLITWLEAVLWPLMRILGVLLAAPVFGAGGAPAQIRLVFGLVLALALAPLLPAPSASVAVMSADWWLRSLHETLIGVAMGFVLQLVFEAAMLGGELIGNGMGLGFAQMIDPVHNQSAPLIGMFLRTLLCLLFLASGAHLVLIEAIAKSLKDSPPSPHLGASDAMAIAGFGGQIFEAGVLIALPIVAAMMLVNLAFGVMSRAAPTLNATSVGFPMTLLAGFILLRVDVPVMMRTMNGWLLPAFQLIGHLGMSRGG